MKGFSYLSGLITSGGIFISLSLMSSMALAEQPNIWYLGTGVLSVKSDYVHERDMRANHDQALFSAGGGATDYNQHHIEFDDHTVGYRWYIGVTANENFDFEGSFIDLDKVAGSYMSADLVDPLADVTSAKLFSEASIDGLAINVQYSPTVMENGEALVRIGIYNWDATQELVFTNDDPTFTPRRLQVENDGYDEYFGIGFRYRLNGKLRLRADLDRFVMAEAEADVLSAVIEFEY